MKLDGQYNIIFQQPHSQLNEGNFKTFNGVCENFTPSGKCVFLNDENEMLVVHYNDIVQMKPVKKEYVNKEMFNKYLNIYLERLKNESEAVIVKKDEFELIKKYWLAPIFTEFPYSEQRDAGNDIEWLIGEVEKLRSQISELRGGSYETN